MKASGGASYWDRRPRASARPRVVAGVAEDDDRRCPGAPAGAEPTADEGGPDAGPLAGWEDGHRGEPSDVELGAWRVEGDRREGDVADDLSSEHGDQGEVGGDLVPQAIDELRLLRPAEGHLVEAVHGGAVGGMLGADLHRPTQSLRASHPLW